MTDYQIVLKNGEILEGYDTLQGCLNHVRQLKCNVEYGTIEIDKVIYGDYEI